MGIMDALLRKKSTEEDGQGTINHNFMTDSRFDNFSELL